MSDQDPMFFMRRLNGDEWVFLVVPALVLVGAYLVHRWRRGRPDQRRWDRVSLGVAWVVAAALLIWSLFFRVVDPRL